MNLSFTPQGKNAETGTPAWHAADFDSFEHLLETTGAWIPTPVDRPIVFGRHSQTNLGAMVVVTDIGTPKDLERRKTAAAANSPEVRLLLDGALDRNKASSAALAAADRIRPTLTRSSTTPKEHRS